MFFVAFKNYCKKHKSKSTLHGFVNNNEHHKELITTWFETYITYEDAMNSLMRKFKRVYKNSTKANYKSKTIPDLSSLFTQSELQKSTMKNGARVLNETINTTAKKTHNKIEIGAEGIVLAKHLQKVVLIKTTSNNVDCACWSYHSFILVFK